MRERERQHVMQLEGRDRQLGSFEGFVASHQLSTRDRFVADRLIGVWFKKTQEIIDGYAEPATRPKDSHDTPARLPREEPDER